MKMIIQIVLVALVVGGISAGGSFYWHQKNVKPTAVDAKAKVDKDGRPIVEEAASTEKPAGEPALADVPMSKTDEPQVEETEPKPEKAESKADTFSFGPPVGQRPPYDPNGDEAGDLINRLRVRMASTSHQERRIAEREEAMRLIVDDLRSEQTKAAKLRKRLVEEQTHSLRSIDESRAAMETERGVIYDELTEARRLADERIQAVIREKEEAVQSAEVAMRSVRDEQEAMRKQLDEFRKPAENRDRSGSPEELTNLKKTIEKLEKMPPEDTAKLLKGLAKKGQVEAVVAILDGLPARASGKAISAIAEIDEKLAADLLDRLKQLKQNGTPPMASRN